MTLIDFLRSRYEYGDGENGARTVRRRSVNLFGADAGTQYKPFSEAVPDIWKHALVDVGPCTRAQIIEALHQAADAQDKSDLQERRNRR